MQQHLLIHADGMELRHQPLRLAEGIAEQQRWSLSVPLPPGADVFCDISPCLPAINRQPEGGLGDQHVAGDRFKGLAAGISIPLVVPAHHPNFTIHLEADLG